MLEVTLLGCGATMPLPGRATATCAVKYHGHVALLDCGEGTQVAARQAGVSLVRIDAICLTHYHGDHVFGLPGLLQTMASQGRTQPVFLLGPENGYAEMVELLLALAGPLPFAIQRRPLHLPQDSICLWDGLLVKTQLLHHRVACVGYRFELPRAGRFQPDKAQELGVPCRLWGKLQKGECVQNTSGNPISPEQVMGKIRKGLSVVYATDTAPFAELPIFAKEADLLICDATYAEEQSLKKAQLYGHSTFAQCGQLAVQANVKRLWLTHFGGALTDPEAELSHAQQFYPCAEAGFDGKTIRLNFVDE